MYTVGDLFAGVGGIARGFIQSGLKVLWANEIDKSACITYRANFKEHEMFEGDIHKLNPEYLKKVDILCGGFPCQAFSIAGYRKGFNDDRGNLFYEIIRLADHLQPRVLFLENVKNLKTHDKGNTYKTILECLEAKGYYVWSSVLNTYEYSDIPQNRGRLYIIAFKEHKAFEAFKPPKKVNKLKSPQALLDRDVGDSFYYKNSKYYKILKEEMINPKTIYQWRRVYLRENKSGLCPTLTANMGMGGHNVPLIIDHKDIRKLTPRECFRFQGFPDEHVLPKSLANSALYKQAGNSVSVPVIHALANKIKQALQFVDQNGVVSD